VELKDKDFFGDTAFDTKSNRNATVHALEDTHLCYLEKEHYDLLLRVDKKSQRLSSLHFLYDNFFLKHLSQDIFANLFFNNFIYEEKPKNAILFEQYNPSNFLYLIRYGEIELSNKSSIVQVYYLTKYLSQLNLEDNIKEYIKKVKNVDTSKLAPVVKNDFYFMKKDLTKKKDYFLFNVLSKDLIGLESLVFDMPYLYTAKVISKSAFLYKIEKSVLFQLIKNYDNILNHMGKDGKQKMKLILERFIEINRFQIKMVDKNISKKIKYHNLRLNEMKENKKIQKAIDILMSQNNKIKTNENENEKEIENYKKCLSENSRMSLDIFGENYSIFNIKRNQSYKMLIRLSEKNKQNKNNNNNNHNNNIYHNEKLRNLRIINFNQNDNIHLKPEKHLILDKIKNNEKKEDKKVNNFFFTQPINKSRNYMSKIDKEYLNNDNPKLLNTKFDKNNLLFKVDNNFISLNIYNDRYKDIYINCPKANKIFHNYKNNVPYILKTIVNIEKIKSLKFNPKGLSSSKKDIKKKIKLVSAMKKSFSFNRKSIIGSQ
jgi:CRP-like cAMP-binding protein